MKKNLIEEKYIPEEEGSFGGKTTSMLNDGSIQKDVRIPFCDFCGLLLKEEKSALCSSCRRKLCSSCIVMHESRYYCRDCAKQIIDITKEQFMILFGVANDVNLGKIRKFSYLNSDDLREHLSLLFERGLIDKKGFSIFNCYIPTDKGLSALPTCEQIYRNEGDAQQFITKIHGFLGEKR